MNKTSAPAGERLTHIVVAILSIAVIGIVAALFFDAPTSGHNEVVASPLATINALLNGAAAVLLSLGFYFIRRRRVRAHRICMMAAVVISALFLVSYLAHHYQVGSVRFAGPSWLKGIYLAILLPHIALSTVMVPMVLMTLAYAWRGRFVRHRRIARWTLPVWLFVSASGVMVYVLLYHVHL